jgi:hypothetical protein
MATSNLIAWPTKPKTTAKRAPVEHPRDATYLQMPASCMYGYLAAATQSLEGPITWGYSTMLGIYSAMAADAAISKDLNYPEHLNLYVGLLGPVAWGKSVTMTRARRTLNPDAANLETDTPGSDRGLYKMFGPKEKEAMVLRKVCLLQDEMRDLLAKTGVPNSSLAPAMCKLFNDDTAGSAIASGHHKMVVRLSIVGGIKTDDITDFQSVFGHATAHGLYSRFVFCPPPEKKWRWLDKDWTPRMGPPPTDTKVRISTENRAAVQAWEDEYEALGMNPGRFGEIATRVAVLSAAANGESIITDACMTAALNFASWQAATKYGYRSGEALDDDAQCTSAMLDALRAVGCNENGVPNRVKFTRLVKQRNWNRKFGAPRVGRIKDTLARQGILHVESELDETCKPPREKETGWVSLHAEEFEK